jgi:hypothetical protein
MPPDGQWLWSATETPIQAASRLSDLKAAGGYDANALSRGDWSNQAQYSAYLRYNVAPTNISYLIAQGNYNYRGMPCYLVIGGYTWPTDVKNARVLRVKPNLYVQTGTPMFKTQKLLGNRAIVSDSFSQSMAFDGDAMANRSTWSYQSKPVFGKGQYAHRDGYNVLYGDWSAKWYGDPQSRILWWSPPHNVGYNDTYYTTPFGASQYAGIWSNQFQTSGGATVTWDEPCSTQIWHVFDEAAGIDGGAY